MVKSVFFRHCIIKLTEKECNELKRTCKTPILKKLNLSENYLRKMMYIDKKLLGLGLMRPKTTLATLNLKQYLGNMRSKINMLELFEVNE